MSATQNHPSYYDDMDDELDRLLDTHRGLTGARVIHTLRSQANLPIPIAHLRHCDAELESNLPIPMTDYPAIRGVLKRVKLLKAEIHSQTELGLDCASLQREYEALLKYLKECTLAGNRIRNFCDDDAKEYQRIKHATNRFIRLISLQHPALALELKKKLVTGKVCMWRD